MIPPMSDVSEQNSRRNFSILESAVTKLSTKIEELEARIEALEPEGV